MPSTLPHSHLLYMRFATYVGCRNGHPARGWIPRRRVVTNPDPVVGGASSYARRLMSANSSGSAVTGVPCGWDASARASSRCFRASITPAGQYRDDGSYRRRSRGDPSSLSRS